jgi:hypothetical protein
MRMREHMILTVSGLVFAGGTVLVGGPANAATPTSHENIAAASQGATYGELSITNPDRFPTRPKCRRYMPGKYVMRRERGRSVRVYVPGHWLPRGCTRSRGAR